MERRVEEEVEMEALGTLTLHFATCITNTAPSSLQHLPCDTLPLRSCLLLHFPSLCFSWHSPSLRSFIPLTLLRSVSVPVPLSFLPVSLVLSGLASPQHSRSLPFCLTVALLRSVPRPSQPHFIHYLRDLTTLLPPHTDTTRHFTGTHRQGTVYTVGGALGRRRGAASRVDLRARVSPSMQEGPAL